MTKRPPSAADILERRDKTRAVETRNLAGLDSAGGERPRGNNSGREDAEAVSPVLRATRSSSQLPPVGVSGVSRGKAFAQPHRYTVFLGEAHGCTPAV